MSQSSRMMGWEKSRLHHRHHPGEPKKTPERGRAERRVRTRSRSLNQPGGWSSQRSWPHELVLRPENCWHSSSSSRHGVNSKKQLVSLQGRRSTVRVRERAGEAGNRSFPQNAGVLVKRGKALP